MRRKPVILAAGAEHEELVILVAGEEHEELVILVAGEEHEELVILAEGVDPRRVTRLRNRHVAGVTEINLSASLTSLAHYLDAGD